MEGGDGGTSSSCLMSFGDNNNNINNNNIGSLCLVPISYNTTNTNTNNNNNLIFSNTSNNNCGTSSAPGMMLQDNNIKAKIMSHPHYPRLLSAYLNCQKIGAPPEVVERLEEACRASVVAAMSSREGGGGGGSSDGGMMMIGQDPALDQFMEAYCEMLIKYEQELSKPFKEAMLFLSRVESQFKAISISTSDSAGAEGGLDRNGSSEEEVDVSNNLVDPQAEDRELKGQLLRKYSGYLGSLKQEFMKKRKKGKLPKEARQQLLDWWTRHYKWPYPSEAQKLALAESTGLDQKQINNWFINQRKRHWKPSEDMQFVVMDAAHPYYFMENMLGNPYAMDVGMLVQDPKKRNDVDAIFKEAMESGGVEGPMENLRPSSSRSFTGAGRLLSGEPVPAQAAPEQPQNVIHTIVFWRNGFTVNDGPLRRMDDPENARFLESIRKSECPRELEPAVRRSSVHCNLIKRDENCPVTEPVAAPQVSFQGVGRTLGRNADDAVPEANDAPTCTPSAALVLDSTLPSTSIQLRLADGTRMVAHFNLHTVSDIRAYINSSRPDGPRTYQLQTVGFPPQQLTDQNQTIEQAGLANSVVIQKL